jgi:aspartyl-tRNA(Asn)/glutamyl-tRNA(Gln) amidotransferase subunit C
MALAIKGHFIGIYATGNVFCQYPPDIAFEFLRIGVGSERMEVSHHKITLILLLHPHIVAQRPEIVPQMEIPRRPDAAHDNLFIYSLLHREGEDKEFRVLVRNPNPFPIFVSMEVNIALVDKLANLARLQFAEEEKELIRQDLQRMIGFVDKLNELNTEGVEPLLHMTEAVNILREDVVEGSVPREVALKNAPETDGVYFKVPKVISRES